MSQRGQTCRKRDRRDRGAREQIEVEVQGDVVHLRVRGEVVRTLTGRAADEIRAVLDNPSQLDRVVSRQW